MINYKQILILLMSLSCTACLVAQRITIGNQSYATVRETVKACQPFCHTENNVAEPKEPDVSFTKSNVILNSGNLYDKIIGADMTGCQLQTGVENTALSDQLTLVPGQMPQLNLQANSEAIDALDQANQLEKDLNGQPRQVPDIGTLEF